MKEIILITNSLKFGGAERILLNIGEILSSNYKIIIFQSAKGKDFKCSDKFEIINLDHFFSNNSFLGKIFSGLISTIKLVYLKRKHPNAISISLTLRPNIINIFSKMLTHNKSFIYEVTTPSEIYKSKSLTALLSKFFIRFFYKYADKIIANSYGVRRDLLENFFISKKIEMIYSPIDIKKNKLNVSDIDKLPKSKYRLVTVSRLDISKNISLCIRSLAKLGNDFSLIVIGDGPELKNLKMLAKDLKISNKVVFTGFKTAPFTLFDKRDIFLFSSNIEGLPTVLVEALISGLSVISTDCRSGPREILDKKFTNNMLTCGYEVVSCGILIPVDHIDSMVEAIMHLVDNPNLIERFRINAPYSYDRFSFESFKREFVKLID